MFSMIRTDELEALIHDFLMNHSKTWDESCLRKTGLSSYALLEISVITDRYKAVLVLSFFFFIFVTSLRFSIQQLVVNIYLHFSS